MMQQTTVVVQQPPAYSPIDTHGYMIINPVPLFGENSMTVVCGNCGRQGPTKIVPENGVCAHLCAFMLAFIFLPCACVPLCSGSCKDYSHYCSACNAKLGTYKRL
ncbi:Lipopolysaccharide-induced tumor necrosis like protein [Argiope bruennichi]|uniref:Lipopolysaccharide-induced tumor necrosis like protein n=1 Tax=Argiope bruennichi TaxID=94029 RepID=A0A8T0EX66_ARGBR|nr:Lipopolysaccharide-induced tumor necrosis like protein [Argiope bruennichi]